MKDGTVKFFNEEKGFGFITDNESGKDFFVHVSGLVDEIKKNDKVTFDIRKGKKGEEAFDVRVV